MESIESRAKAAYPYLPGTDEEAQHFFHWSDQNIWSEGFEYGAKDAETKMDPVLKAFKQLVHLHMCEQEGLASGMPSSADWFKAVEAACEVLEPFDLRNYVPD